VADTSLRSGIIAAVGDGQGNPRVTDVDENVITDGIQVTDQFATSDVT
jgi:hypothetical protein